MVTELHLGGFELVAYALVHQFSQKGKGGLYIGGVPYLASWLRCSEMTARKYLHSLEEKGLIEAKEGNNGGVPYRYYKVNENQIPKIFGDTPKKIEEYPKKSITETPKKIGVDINNDNKEIVNIPPTPQAFIPPTSKVVAAYARSQGFIDPEGFAAHFCEYYAQSKWHLANGKPMKDWKKAVITWKPNNQYRRFTPSYTPATPKQFKPVDIDEIL